MSCSVVLPQVVGVASAMWAVLPHADSLQPLPRLNVAWFASAASARGRRFVSPGPPSESQWPRRGGRGSRGGRSSEAVEATETVQGSLLVPA